jgi:hypothetical protein
LTGAGIILVFGCSTLIGTVAAGFAAGATDSVGGWGRPGYFSGFDDGGAADDLIFHIDVQFTVFSPDTNQSINDEY